MDIYKVDVSTKSTKAAQLLPTFAAQSISNPILRKPFKL